MLTSTLGYATATIPASEVDALLAFLRARAFHALHTHYRPTSTDHPRVTMVLHQGRAVKVVEHDTSNQMDPALAEIEKEIDRVARTAHWIGKGSSTSAGRATSIPQAALRRMVGAPLRQACAAAAHTKMALGVASDDLGFGSEGFGSSYETADRAVHDCLVAALRQSTFPLPNIAGELNLPL